MSLMINSPKNNRNQCGVSLRASCVNAENGKIFSMSSSEKKNVAKKLHVVQNTLTIKIQG